MNKSLIIIFSTLFFISSLILSGCSSGSGDGGGGSGGLTYSGDTGAAAINSTSAEPLATTAGEAVQNAGTSTGLPVFASIGSVDSDALAQDIVNIIRNSQAVNLPASYTESGSCGGNVTIPDGAYNQESGPVTTDITFSNYCDQYMSNGTYILNGTVHVHADDVNSLVNLTMEFTNFTVNDNGNITKINATITCDNTGCNTSSDFTGADGHVHRVSDVSISGDPVNGFNGSMTFYHYTYGSVSVTAYNVMFGSCVDFPDGGSIDFTGTNGSYGSVNFASDCTYTGTYYDGVTSGSFSGSFN